MNASHWQTPPPMKDWNEDFSGKSGDDVAPETYRLPDLSNASLLTPRSLEPPKYVAKIVLFNELSTSSTKPLEPRL